MSRYEKLMRKSERYMQKSLKSNSTKLRFFYQDISDKLREKALALPISKASRR